MIAEYLIGFFLVGYVLGFLSNRSGGANSSIRRRGASTDAARPARTTPKKPW